MQADLLTWKLLYHRLVDSILKLPAALLVRLGLKAVDFRCMMYHWNRIYRWQAIEHVSILIRIPFQLNIQSNVANWAVTIRLM